MITITINIENGNEASEACREVARMIDNGYQRNDWLLVMGRQAFFV